MLRQLLLTPFKRRVPIFPLINPKPIYSFTSPKLNSNTSLYRTFTTTIPIRMKVNFQVVGTNSSLDGRPSCLLFFDNKRYLFNCGETTQRQCIEKGVRIAKFDALFLSSIRWDAVGGLGGLLLTRSDSTDADMDIYGPANLTHYLTSMRHFIGRPKINLNVTEFKLDSPHYKDENITVHPVHISPTNSTTPTIDPRISEKLELMNLIYHNPDSPSPSPHPSSAGEPQTKRPRLSPNTHPFFRGELPPTSPRTEVLSYIVHAKDVPGKFDVKAALALGLKPGPIFKKLQGGKSVVNANGETILPSQCVGAVKPGKVVIIIDCPSLDYIQNLTLDSKFMEYRGSEAKHQFIIVYHMLGPGVILDTRYQQFINSFGKETQHFLSSPDTCPATINFHRSAQAQLTLSQLDPEIFSLPYHSVQPQTPLSSLFSSDILKNIHLAEPGFEYQLEPKPKALPVKNRIGKGLTDPTNKYGVEMASMQDFLKAVNKYRQSSPFPRSAEKSDGPFLSTLGTGSALPSLTRNVSSNLLTLPNKKMMLLDCGEGTAGQVYRHLGITTNSHPKIQQSYSQFLENLQMIYISHPHADHNFGLIGIMDQVHQYLNQKSEGNSGEVRYLIAPRCIFLFLKEYSQTYNFGLNRWKFIDSYLLQFNKPTPENVKPTIEDMFLKLNVKSIQTCLVSHCQHAFAIRIDPNDAPSLVYSGDTRPCNSIIELGRDVDVLLHEATLDDDLLAEAKAKRHSTTSEAISQAKLMNSKKLVLTHFSQRYPDFKKLESAENMKLVVANDLMCIDLNHQSNDFQKFKRMGPAIGRLVSDQARLEELENVHTI